MRNTKELISLTVQDSVFWNVHDHLKGKSLTELQTIQKQDTLPFAVCVLNLTGDLNVGMIVRTACIFGAREVIIFGRRKYDKRSTVGAQQYIEIDRVSGLTDDERFCTETFLSVMNEKNYFPIYVEQGGADISTIESLQIPSLMTPCLVLGNENEGVPEELLKTGYVISIGQRGVLRSLNVSAAAAIVMYHFSSIL